MRERGHVLQPVPFGRDNYVTIVKPKADMHQRQELSISNDTTTFNFQFRHLGDILQHCKRALTDMKLPDGTLKPFPEDEFNLIYGAPSAWKSWYDAAVYAKYKVKVEGFLNPDTDDWSKYSNELSEWSQNQGFLHLDDPKMKELMPGTPTGKFFIFDISRN